MRKREILANLSYTFNGDWTKISEGVASGIMPRDFHIEENYITILDKEYPDEFFGLRHPPWVIFYEGDYSLLNSKKITIVGTRKPTEYGKEMTKFVVNNIKDRYTTVSGLAKGIDGYVHRFSLDRGKTIGIIGSGLGTEYPSENRDIYKEMKKSHLILSEYPYHVGIQKRHFPWRNRLLAALGDKLIVVEAKIQSGTILTVNEAISLSKDIYCIPHDITNKYGEGCNKLIAEGAYSIYDEIQLKEL